MTTRISHRATNSGHCKAVLEAKLRELLSSPAGRSELEIEHLADAIDQIQSGIERDVAVQRLNQKAREIQSVRSALEKMRAGAFGICEECHGRIAQARLEALPWARLCVKCQSGAEARPEEDLKIGRAA